MNDFIQQNLLVIYVNEFKIHPKMSLKPLPDSLKNSKDTVCSYCGVSYLVLHEMERYENMVADLKKQITILERK